MNSRVLLLASLFGGIITLSTKAQTITAPTGQNLTITNPVDVTGAGNTINIPNDGSYKIGGSSILNIKGTFNVSLGFNAGLVNTSGSTNVFAGAYAGYGNTSGSGNTFIGGGAGEGNTSGGNNMFLGTAAGAGNTAGSSNVFIGVNAGRFSNSADNCFIGTSSGYANIGGLANSGFGTGSGAGNTTGSSNVFMGVNAGTVNTSGSSNVFIGNSSNAATGTLTNATAIGSGAIVSTSNTVVLGSAATTVIGTGLSSSRALSGLVLSGFNSGNPTTAVGGNKVLSVDGSGNVVLVQLTTGTVNSVGGNGPVAESNWKDQDGYLYNNSTNGVVINGTGLEGNSLIVKGGILSKEVNVKVEGSESWPDYVFKPSYKRMSLDEVEKFININGHLPNVASATEMAATGNNLNKTDIKLLEKVEELTLYLLEMKKANEVQNSEIQNLKKQVKSLRKK